MNRIKINKDISYDLPAHLVGKTMSLADYLHVIGASVDDFALKAKLDRNTVYKAYRGLKVRIDTAKKIVRASKKAVTLEALGHGR